MTRAEGRRRYEGVMRSLYGRQVRYLAVCWGTMAALLALHVLVVAPALAPLAVDLPIPRWGAVIVTLLPFGVAVIVLPGLVQLAVTPPAERAAFEALSAFALLDRDRWLSSTGVTPRGAFRTPEQGLRWIENHPSVDPVQQVRLLAWAGRHEEADRIIGRLPDDDAIWRVHRASLASMLAHVRDGERGGTFLATAEPDVAELPRSPAGDYALLGHALERARLAHAAGEPPWPVLADARRRIHALPAGAAIRERWVASMRTSGVVFAVVAAMTIALRL